MKDSTFLLILAGLAIIADESLFAAIFTSAAAICATGEEIVKAIKEKNGQ